ncbi:hypothetical protein [Candidatus Parabeggiatoa sp. HSG14]|uniref:hypothetical protein n=1 Tax=Candidatus Parabeggiatoa sp. HSG14 TaxID=3055593 RepID=UPI0025A6E9D3|nr:hypothetical protein [Thiotrichales bacterium HSG14]
MQYLFKNCRGWFLVLLVNFTCVFNVHAFLDLVIACEYDVWNDTWDSNTTINNICNIKLLDKETIEVLMEKLEKLDLSKPAQTAVKGAIQGFKEELEKNLKPLLRELNTLLKERMDQAGKLVADVDDRVEKRIAQITKAINDTVKSFRKNTMDIIQQVEKSTTKIVDDMVSKLESMVSKLNSELSKKFETIRGNIKTDIMFIGDYVSCKTSGTMVNFEQSLKNVVKKLPFSKSGKKFCQSCEAGFFSSPDERECFCCRNVKLLDKNNKPLTTNDMKLFRYNACMLKNELSGNSQISDILDAYAIIQKWAMDIYCQSDTVRIGKKLLIQSRMEEEIEKAYEDDLFWSTEGK